MNNLDKLKALPTRAMRTRILAVAVLASKVNVHNNTHMQRIFATMQERSVALSLRTWDEFLAAVRRPSVNVIDGNVVLPNVASWLTTEMADNIDEYAELIQELSARISSIRMKREG